MSFRLVPMTLNDVMALILHYFVYDIVVKQLLGLPRFQSLLLVVYGHIKTICAIIQRLFGQNKLLGLMGVVHR